MAVALLLHMHEHAVKAQDTVIQPCAYGYRDEEDLRRLKILPAFLPRK